MRGVSSAIAEAAEMADGAELDEEEWPPEAVPDLEEEWPDTFPDLVDLQERETDDSVADFDEESADAVSVAFER